MSAPLGIIGGDQKEAALGFPPLENAMPWNSRRKVSKAFLGYALRSFHRTVDITTAP